MRATSLRSRNGPCYLGRMLRPDRRPVPTMASPSPTPPRAAAAATVNVRAPGRLHLGFLDPSGSLGRRFGSLGLVVDGLRNGDRTRPCRDTMRSARRHAVAPPNCAARRAHLQTPAPAHRAARRRCPCACARHCRRMPVSARAPSSRWRWAAPSRTATAWRCRHAPRSRAWLGRGLRSGVGIAGFDAGRPAARRRPGCRRRAGAAALAHRAARRRGGCCSCSTRAFAACLATGEAQAHRHAAPVATRSRGRHLPPGADARAAWRGRAPSSRPSRPG